MPSARSRTPASSARLSQFRGSRRPLPPGDKRVLIALLVHLCFLPWALGTMHPWSQVTSLVLAAIGFIVALTAPRADKPETGRRLGGDGEANLKPEDGLAPYSGGYGTQVSGFKFQVSRLLRFPPFWLGLALLVYIAVQASNPSWRYVTNGTHWWLVKLPNIEWLPTSVDTPFARFNVWRQFIIYASAWLTLCTVVIGITRRRSFGLLLGGLAANGLLFILLGFMGRLVGSQEFLWFEGRAGSTSFAAFIYKNHAGAYLALIAGVLLALAARQRERALREHSRSSPALLGMLGALVAFFAVIFTYSRGGTLLLAGYLVVSAVFFLLHRVLTGAGSSTPKVVTFTICAMVASVCIFALAQVDFERVLDRFERLADTEHQDISVKGRIDAHAASRDMLYAVWPQGVGAGGFRHLFPQYIRRFSESYRGGKVFWEHAHNDWLEIPIELGLAGSLLLAGGALWWLWRLIRLSIWKSLPPALLALGLLQTLAHASIDFPFQNPAILITWGMLAMIVVRYNTVENEAPPGLAINKRSWEGGESAGRS